MFAKGLPVHITGGMEIHVKELAEGLVRRGHKITIITTRHPKGIEKEETNLKIYYVGDKPLKYTTKEFREESVKLFLKLNEEENFDLVHSQSGAGVWYALKCKKIVPLIITFHGIALNEAKSLWNTGLIGWGKGMYILVRGFINYHVFNHKLFFERAGKIIAVSNKLAEDIKRQYKVPEVDYAYSMNGFSFSLVVLESLALGTIVVAYNIPAIREVYGGISAVYTVQEGDIKSMAEETIKVLRMSENEYRDKHENPKTKSFLKLHSSWESVAKTEIEEIKNFVKSA